MLQNTTEKSGAKQGWTLPPPKPGSLKPGLYLIATPIGNLGDITLRALEVLSNCDVVLCEDTRISGKLLSYYEIKQKLEVYNDHSDQKARDQIIGNIEEGKVVALLSDAGMPLISDPGFKLIQACQLADVHVTSLPGASAPLAALQLSGLPTDRFCFLGFLPNKTTARIKFLKEWEDTPASLIVFENASRVPAALADIAEALGDRDIAIVRELTKLYEEVIHGRISDVIKNLDGKLKGEVVLVVRGASPTVASDKAIEALLAEALKTKSTKEAAAHVASQSGWSRKNVYELAIKLGKDSED